MELINSLNYNSDKIKILNFKEESNIAELRILFYFSGNIVHIKELFIIHHELFKRKKKKKSHI